jgi:toxin ParE1/3/4
MGRLLVNDRVDADLDEIADYIARDDLDAALRFYDAARRAFHFLSDYPRAGAIHVQSDPRFAEMRLWPISRFRDYLVCYIPLSDGVVILRVIHGARDVRRIFP